MEKRVRATEERLHQAEQDTPLPQTSPPECAKQRAAPVSEEGEGQPLFEGNEAGVKVLCQARLPKWRGHFQWQIEAKVEALQATYARLRAEVANEGG